MAIFYNLHNFLKIKVEEGKFGLVGGYDNYLREFRENQIDENFDYEVREFSEFHLPSRYFINDGSITGFESGFCLPKEKYAIVSDGDKITEYTTYANRATNLWLQVLLLNRGLSFIHGAGAEIGGKGVIFPSLGGVGKTILMSELRKLDNFKFFGDDYVIVDEKGNIYSYPGDFSIYNYHLPFFPELKSTPFSRYLRRRKVFKWYYEAKRAINFAAKRLVFLNAPLFKGWHADYVKVPAVNLIVPQKIGTKTKLFAGIFLERHNGEKIESAEMSLEKFVKAAAGILNLEFGQGISYLHALSAAGCFDMADFQIKQRQILQNAFSGVKLYRVRIPRNAAIGDYLGYMNKYLNSIIQ